MIFLFCVDTSASMNQRTTNGVRLIDAAKAGIEHFMLKRASDFAYATDRFFLVTFGDSVSAIKAGWTDDTADFLRELKMLEAFDLSNLGAALKKSFDLLNSNRVNSPTETFGMGRQMWSLEPAAVVLLTDGGMMMDGTSPANDLVLPAGSSYHGIELYKEPFRWDQRLHVIQLRFASGSHANSASADKSGGRFSSGLSHMAQSTGGTFATASSMNHLIRSMDALVMEYSSRKPPCVSIDFEPLPATNSHGSNPLVLNAPASMPSSQTAPSAVQRIQIRAQTGTWPLPEDFWVGPTTASLPPRFAVPRIWYKPTPVPHPRVHFGFPADVYDLDPASSVLAQWVIDHVPKAMVLECFANMDVMDANRPNSTFLTNSTGETSPSPSSNPPFAFIAAYADGVKLVVQIYNYPALNSLLALYQNRTPKWKVDFEKYVSSLPSYYISPLKATLKQLNLPNAPLLSGHTVHPSSLILDTHVATCKELPSECAQWLSDMKSRAQAGRAAQIAEIANARKLQLISERTGGGFSSRTGANEKMDRSQLLLQIDILRSRLSSLNASTAHSGETTTSSSTSGAFDARRRMETRFDDEEAKHHVPISEMGDFQTYLAKKPPPLKSIDDSLTQIGKPYFGNPFTKGDAGAFVDEVGVSGPASGGAGAGAKKLKKRKRKFEIAERADKFKQFMITDSPSGSNGSGSLASHSHNGALSGASSPVPTTSSSHSGHNGNTSLSLSSHPSSPASTSTTASPAHSLPSSPAHSLFDSAFGSPHHQSLSSLATNSTTPPAVGTASSGPQTLATSAKPSLAHAAQAFANLQKTRKEQLQKWDKAPQPPASSASNNGPASPIGGMPASLMGPSEASALAPSSTAPLSPGMLLQHAHHNHALTLRVLVALRRPNAPDEQVLKACCAELRGPAELRARALKEWALLANTHRVEASKFFNTLNL